MKTEIKITDRAIDAGDIIEKVIIPESGGIDVFIGTVRNHTKGKEVLHLEYEAYIPMAEKEIERILNSVADQWKVYKAVVHHRIGHLGIGEKAIVIAVSAAHRAEAFEACRFIIEEIKQTVPIWKKEIFKDGEIWVSAHP